MGPLKRLDDEIVEPKAYEEFAFETMDEFALDVASDTFASTALAGPNLPAVEESWSNNGRWMINGRGSSYMQGVAANVKAKETSFETSVSPRTWDERNS